MHQKPAFFCTGCRGGGIRLTNIRDWVVAVTGASSGIGALAAQLLAERGAYPVLIARRSDKLEQVGARIGAQHMAIAADVADGIQVERAVARIIAERGRIDAWINNAGFGVFKPLEETPRELYEQMMATNYYALVHSAKAVLPHMRRAGRGQLVTVASVAGKLGTAKATAYTASKHAALGFTASLRAELQGSGITVTSVNPGPIDTPFFDIADPDGGYRKNLGPYMLRPERVARAMVDVIGTRKADVTLPWTAAAGVKLLQLFPNALSDAAAKLLNRK